MLYKVRYTKDTDDRVFLTHDLDHARNMAIMTGGAIRDAKGHLVSLTGRVSGVNPADSPHPVEAVGSAHAPKRRSHDNSKSHTATVTDAPAARRRRPSTPSQPGKA